MKHTLTKTEIMSCECIIFHHYAGYLTNKSWSMIYLGEHLRDVIENSSASAQLPIFLQFRGFLLRRGGFSRREGGCLLFDERVPSLVVRRLFALRSDEDG